MSQIQYLDPEIANEGVHAEKGALGVIPHDWEPDEEYQPAIEPPHIPDYKGIKSIAQYFPQFSGRPYRIRAYPAWFYHAKHEPKLVNNPMEAAQIGATWSKTEFKFDCTGEWKSKPVKAAKATSSGPGKWLTSVKEAATNTADLIAAAVAATLAKIGNTTAPKVQEVLSTDPDYALFMQFKAFKEQQALMGFPPTMDVATSVYPATRPLAEPSEKAQLIEAAAARGIKLDKRWGLDKIKAALDEAA